MAEIIPYSSGEIPFNFTEPDTLTSQGGFKWVALIYFYQEKICTFSFWPRKILCFWLSSVSSSRCKSLWIDKTIRQSGAMTDDAGSQDNTQIEKRSGYVARVIFKSSKYFHFPHLKDNLIFFFLPGFSNKCWKEKLRRHFV